jgi:hypothetical protein
MDLYCGAGGMTAGLTMAGIEATHGVESDAQVREREGGPKPMHSCGNTAVEAEVGPTSGPTWHLCCCGHKLGCHFRKHPLNTIGNLAQSA